MTIQTIIIHNNYCNCPPFGSSMELIIGLGLWRRLCRYCLSAINSLMERSFIGKSSLGFINPMVWSFNHYCLKNLFAPMGMRNNVLDGM